jgi:hypothetical protein
MPRAELHRSNHSQIYNKKSRIFSFLLIVRVPSLEAASTQGIFIQQECSVTKKVAVKLIMS